MTKHVVLIADPHEGSAHALLEALQQAGVSACVTACVEPAQDECALLPFAVLYEVNAGEDVNELRAAVEQAASAWPNTPLVACHRPANGQAIFEQEKLDRATLERVGFRAVADQPAQLPALLRELEEHGMTGELRLPVSIEEAPEQRVPLLPQRLKAKELRASFDLVAMLHFAGNQKGAAQTALEGLSRLVQADRWAIYLTSEVRGVKAPSLELLSSLRFGDEERTQEERLRSALSGETASAAFKETASARKAAARLEIVRKREEELCVVALPLVSGERIIGVLEAVREGEGARPFSRAQTELLGALCVAVACALANSVRIAEAERLSLIDDLTKLHNGRYLRQFLVNEIKRARRYSSSVAALFLDLDDFKGINDMHGHLVGSHVLVEVAAVILQSIRDTDMVARYGGDEFVIVLPETTIEQAAFVAERMREKIAQHEFTGGRRLRLHLTASFGVATFPRHAASPQQLVACADRAMYEAKAARKNCVRFSADVVD